MAANSSSGTGSGSVGSGVPSGSAEPSGPSGPSNPSEYVDDSAPLWRYATKLRKVGIKGGNYEVQCHYCNRSFIGSYSRVHAHLLRITNVGVKVCQSVTQENILEMQRLVEEARLRIQNSRPKEVPLPSSVQSTSSSNSFKVMGFEAGGTSRKKRTGETAIEKSFNNNARSQLHAEIARLFFSAGLPFHLARNPYFIKAFQFAANNNIAGYVPPGYNMLRTTLLQQERANIERLLAPIKSTWNVKGVSIVCDGWTDVQRRPLINFLAVTEGGPMFLNAFNCQGEYKDKFFISNLIIKIIDDVGPHNVVQVITDNAPVCKAAGMLVEAKYPHIFWTPCVVHTLNLALKNICAAKNTEANETVFDECSWINIVAGDVMCIKNFIMQHSMRLAIFNEFVKLKLLAIAETRFASVIVMLKRFRKVKTGLQSMVISDKWTCYREDDVGKAQFVKDKILDDLWWDKIDYILSFTDPIYEMLRIADTDAPCLHLIYEMWDCMIEKVRVAIFNHEKKKEGEESVFYSVVHKILVDRWDKSNTSLHCLAHSLNPRYYSDTWIKEDPNRVAPHQDPEISVMRNKYFNRIFSNTEERKLAYEEYFNFSTFCGPFNDRDSIVDRNTFDPKMWWGVYGSSSRMLQQLALRLLGQPCSSSGAERNWSTYSFIHSMKRNKITPQRAEDLVFVHSNLRLLSRKSPDYTKQGTKMWDVGGDAFDSFDGAGLLDFAELSLDEPDLETVMFINEGKDDEVGNENE